MELPPAHRAETPYDQERDQPVGDDLPGLWVLFACSVLAAVLVGLTCLVVGFVLGSPPTLWTGAGLVAAGALGMRVLWIGEQE